MIHRGVGIDLGAGTFLTAGHVVDGDLRVLTVDEQPAVVVAFDERLDLAVLALVDAPTGSARPIGAWPTDPTDPPEPRPGPVTVLSADEPVETEIVRVVTLRVDDVSALVVHERPALELGYVAEPGHSGAPVLDGAGELVGVVVLSDPSGGRSYAVRPPGSTHEFRRAPPRHGCARE
jgi:S1-C subfamily serine protease